MNKNLRGKWKRWKEMRDSQREKKHRARGSRRNREAETEKSECAQNEKMIRFTCSEATKFVVV